MLDTPCRPLAYVEFLEVLLDQELRLYHPLRAGKSIADEVVRTDCKPPVDHRNALFERDTQRKCWLTVGGTYPKLRITFEGQGMLPASCSTLIGF